MRVVALTFATLLVAGGVAAEEPLPPPDPLEAQRRRELDEMQRRDVAAALAGLGVVARWEDHTHRELVDWRERILTARALAADFGVQIDWRTTSLRQLQNLRLRVAKAARLAADHGVSVDWRRYSWRQLEELRRTAARMRMAAAPADMDALIPPGGAGAPRRPGWRPRDPDAVIEPSFAYVLPPSRGSFFPADPDAILAPTFVSPPRPGVGAGADGILDPWAPSSRRGGAR
jgi:hypothetical protein